MSPENSRELSKGVMCLFESKPEFVEKSGQVSASGRFGTDKEKSGYARELNEARTKRELSREDLGARSTRGET